MLCQMNCTRSYWINSMAPDRWLCCSSMLMAAQYPIWSVREDQKRWEKCKWMVFFVVFKKIFLFAILFAGFRFDIFAWRHRLVWASANWLWEWFLRSGRRYQMILDNCLYWRVGWCYGSTVFNIWNSFGCGACCGRWITFRSLHIALPFAQHMRLSSGKSLRWTPFKLNGATSLTLNGCLEFRFTGITKPWSHSEEILTRRWPTNRCS